MTNTDTLRQLLAEPGIIPMPGVFDAVSVRLAEQAGFKAAFMSGFMVSASRIGMPDTGLISYAEMADQGRNICDAVSIPVVGDGDTGFGNAINVKRTVNGYAQAGFGCVMIEDQLAPKRCGHTQGKQVVSRTEAFQRLQAAVDARDEGADILIMARTDANATDGLEEAIHRCQEFRRIGVDITFLEAPRNVDEMKRYCDEVDGPKMANMVEQGKTPFLSPAELEEIGYKIAIWPAALMLAAVNGMRTELARLAGGVAAESGKATFPELQEIVGFPAYYEAEDKYAAE
ncbi:MAG: isocitrate lyase/PEP mutase family protein [Rhodospirillaceae bacterium]|nr:isocitrate lyase/PEP mutase family protein [Rhodospirillaceae bacterium]